MDVCAFSSSLLLLPSVSWKRRLCALEDALRSTEPREARRPNCSSYIILSSVSVSLVSSSHFCTFPLPPVHAVYSFSLSLAHPLLNNNPSVFKSVCVCGAIFGLSKATRHSLLLCRFSVSFSWLL